ncbi:MAG: hypothetical protein R6V49_07075 [Bacteroidales bacterium]
MESIRIIGIKVTPEVPDATQIQSILTMYGNIIRTRLGLNEEVDEKGNRYGIILLELSGDPEQFEILQRRLERIEGIVLKQMEF